MSVLRGTKVGPDEIADAIGVSDGQSFLMVENSDDFPIVIVQNWAVELQRLVRTR